MAVLRGMLIAVLRGRLIGVRRRRPMGVLKGRVMTLLRADLQNPHKSANPFGGPTVTWRPNARLASA